MAAQWTSDDVRAGVDAALASDFMAGNDEYRPTSYIVNAEEVRRLVQTVVEAVAPAIAARAGSGADS